MKISNLGPLFGQKKVNFGAGWSKINGFPGNPVPQAGSLVIGMRQKKLAPVFRSLAGRSLELVHFAQFLKIAVSPRFFGPVPSKF